MALSAEQALPMLQLFTGFDAFSMSRVYFFVEEHKSSMI